MSPASPRIGVRVPQYGGSWEDIRAVAELLEAAGVDALWVNDHFQSPGRIKSDAAFDAFTTLGALAAVTQRVRLGIAVLSASYRPPQIAAKMAAIVDAIAGGRLVVGLGAGSDVGEHAAWGVRFGTPAERTAGVRKALSVMQTMWEHPDGAEIDGLVAGAPIRPLVRRPPVWLAAHGPVLLRHAGQHADGIVVAWTSPEELADRVAIASAAAAAAGRPPLSVALYTFGLVGPDEDARRTLVADEAARLGTTPERLLRWLGTTGLVGTGEEVRDRLGEYAAAGATDVILALPERVPPGGYAALADALAAGAPARRPQAFGVRPEANLVHTLVGRHIAAGVGDTTAVIDATGHWTYTELAAAARAAAGALARAGVRRGDRVAIALRDGRPWVAAFLGCAWRGAVAIPVDPVSPAERVAVILEDCEPRLVISDGECATGAWPVLDPAMLDDGPGPESAAVHPEDLAYMIYSSGSTGRPKGVMHAHRDVVTGIETYTRHVLELAPGEPCHSSAKLFTSLGFGNGFFRVLGAGATAVLNPARPNPRTTLELAARHGVRVLTGVPTFWAQLVEYLDRHPQPGALAGVRLCVSSGDSLPTGVAVAFDERIGVPLIEGLGCSECSNIVISTRPGDGEPGWIGRVVPGIEVRLRDAEGRDVPDGTPGRLWIRSASNTSGYWRRGGATRELVYGEWIRMGDVLVAERGRYRHVGRVDDLFKVDARWVSPREVEACLLEHPGVREAAVGGVADAAGLIRVVAWIVPAGPPADNLAAELRRHIAHRLAPYMAPRELVVCDGLPRLPSGKLDRKALRDVV